MRRPAVSSHSSFFRSIAVVVILSVVGFAAASLVTLHCHILGDGYIIVHSHPLRGDSHRNTHSHSDQQYLELNAASQILETIIIPPALDGILALPFFCNAVFDSASTPASATASYHPQRAPPCVLFS